MLSKQVILHLPKRASIVPLVTRGRSYWWITCRQTVD